MAILLCTIQGQQYLREQLDAISGQTHPGGVIWASDDASEDGEHATLEEYRAVLGGERFSTHAGPVEGFAANSLSLVCNASITADFYAFSDQDDVWKTDKLKRAVDRQPVMWMPTMMRLACRLCLPGHRILPMPWCKVLQAGTSWL